MFALRFCHTVHYKHRTNFDNRDLHENVEKSKAVHSKVESAMEMDDHSLLQDMLLTMDLIEGVFINPPPSHPRYRVVTIVNLDQLPFTSVNMQCMLKWEDPMYMQNCKDP